jgi:hypothetical protein
VPAQRRALPYDFKELEPENFGSQFRQNFGTEDSRLSFLLIHRFFDQFFG